MGVDFCSLHILVTELLLHRANVIYMDVVYAGFAAVRRSGAKTGQPPIRASAWQKNDEEYGWSPVFRYQFAAQLA